MHTHYFTNHTHHCLMRLDTPHLPTVIQKGTIWLHSLPFAMQGMLHLDVPHIGTHNHLRTHRDLAIVAMVLWPLRARARRCGETTFPRASTLWRANSWPRQLILRLQPSPYISRPRDSCYGVVAPARAPGGLEDGCGRSINWRSQLVARHSVDARGNVVSLHLLTRARRGPQHHSTIARSRWWRWLWA
jgi:hypothetical protein